jgi:hypothetical protein
MLRGNDEERGAESERSVASVPQLPPPKVMGTIVPSYWGILRTQKTLLTTGGLLAREDLFFTLLNSCT